MRTLGYLFAAVWLMCVPGMGGALRAEDGYAQADPEFERLLDLDIDALTVTSVARRQQALSKTPAAVFVITQEDIRRLGVTSIPEALRIVPGLQVARIGSNRWAISARGFNSHLSNNLLVLMDGRSVYTPVHSGVYWDDQDTMLEDIERIEVIRGPGGSTWGANAVNGVINIITRHAASTQGQAVSVATGNHHPLLVSARTGHRVDENTFYRVYAKYRRHDALSLTNGDNAHSEWYRGRAGFRLDTDPSVSNSFTLQGDVYGGKQDALTRSWEPVAPYRFTTLSEDSAHGGNLLGRWQHLFSHASVVTTQAYIDHYSRDELLADQAVTTADLDVQHVWQLSARNTFQWGAGYRLIRDEVEGGYTVTLHQPEATYDIWSAFAQHEHALVPEQLYLTLGSKLEHNDFTGVEVQPSARLAWHPADAHTFWGAVSRAVRTPNRIETDIEFVGAIRAPATAGQPLQEVRTFGSDALRSERLIAYELGHRWQPNLRFFIDSTVFYNDYDRLITISSGGAPFLRNGVLIVPSVATDLGKATTHGLEVAANWHVTPAWRLGAGYHYIDLDVSSPDGSNFLGNPAHSTPRNQFSLRSYLDLPRALSLDTAVYYVDNLTLNGGAFPIEENWRVDARLGWQIQPGAEVSLLGTNLFNADHPEFSGFPQESVGPAWLVKLDWKF